MAEEMQVRKPVALRGVKLINCFICGRQLIVDSNLVGSLTDDCYIRVSDEMLGMKMSPDVYVCSWHCLERYANRREKEHIVLTDFIPVE